MATRQEKGGVRGGTRRKAAPLPGERPLRASDRDELLASFSTALEERDGPAAAHVVHELWMRNEPPANIERMLGMLWRAASESVPEWLPMRYVQWLPRV